VKDIRKMIGKMIGKMIWDAREEAAYLEEKQSARDLRAEKRARLRVIVGAIKTDTRGYYCAYQTV
jgi:hypothetical protein